MHGDKYSDAMLSGSKAPNGDVRRETPMHEFPPPSPLRPWRVPRPVPRSVKSRPLSSPLLISSRRRFHFFLSVRLLRSQSQKPLSELGLVLVCVFCPKFGATAVILDLYVYQIWSV